MIEAAEPIIEEAMKAVERKMREKLGSMIIATLEHQFSVQHHQNSLVITVINRSLDAKL
jgi:hypothetical protein